MTLKVETYNAFFLEQFLISLEQEMFITRVSYDNAEIMLNIDDC